MHTWCLAIARLRVSELGFWSLVGEVGSEAWPGPETEEEDSEVITRGPGRRRRELTLSTAATSWTDILTCITFFWNKQSLDRDKWNQGTIYLLLGKHFSHV